MADKKTEKLAWIAKLKAVADEKRPVWRASNAEALALRRERLDGYASLAKKVEAHHRVFDAFVARFGAVLQQRGVFRGLPRLTPVDLGDYPIITTAFEERQYEVHEGNALFRVTLSPADDFFRGGVLMQHTVSMMNSSWYPDTWESQWDVPVDLALVGPDELDAYVLTVAQYRRRIDLLEAFEYQDADEGGRCFERVVGRVEGRLLEDGTLQRPLWPFTDFTKGAMQGDLGELDSIILRPPAGGAASVSIGPSDSKRHDFSFGLDMTAYDPGSPEGRVNLDKVIGLIRVLVKDNKTWSSKRNVDCLQYDGW